MDAVVVKTFVETDVETGVGLTTMVEIGNEPVTTVELDTLAVE